MKQPTENCSLTEDTSAACLYPSYFSYFAVLILVAASLPASLSYLCKTFLMVLLTLAHCAVNIFILGSVLDCEESRKHWSRWAFKSFGQTIWGFYFYSFTKGKYTLSALLLTCTLALSLLARHVSNIKSKQTISPLKLQLLVFF